MPSHTLTFKLVTPVKTVLEEEVEQVTLDTEEGEITVLPYHSPIVSIVRPGELVIKQNGASRGLSIAGGIVEMFGNTLLVLADTAEHANEIELERAEKKATELAQELSSQEHMDITTYNTLQRQLEKEQARVHVAKKWRK